MAIDAPQWYTEAWKDGVIHHYQSQGFTLKNATTPPVKMDGKTMYFLIAGVGEAEENVANGDDAVPINNGREKVPVTTSKSRAFSEVYEDDLDLMNVNEIDVEAKTAAMALGRVHDKTIINALAAVDFATTLKTVSDYNTTAGLIQLLNGKQLLQKDDVPVSQGGIFWAVDSVIWANLLTFKAFASSDYVGPNLPYLQAGLAKSWNGVHIICVSDSLLPLANTTERDTFMWDVNAMGFGWVRKLTGSVAWDNRKDCWTHNMRMRIGAKNLLPKGVVKIKSDYNFANVTTFS